MACLNMQQQQQQQQQMKNDHQKGLFMGPRISFSNDFVESKNHRENMSYREAPVSSDFEFSVPTFSSNSADEVFFKLPPLKEMKNSKVSTLRDELLAGDDDDDDDGCNKNSSTGTGTGTGWWREKFRLRKSQHNKNHGGGGGGGLETIHETKIKPTFNYTPNFTGSHHQYK